LLPEPDYDDLEKENKLIIKLTKQKLIFNNLECQVLILKNLTDVVDIHKANYYAESMRMLTT